MNAKQASRYNRKDEIDVVHGDRVYLATREPSIRDPVDPRDLYTPNLNGGSVEYDVDLSEHDCGCNAALYLV